MIGQARQGELVQLDRTAAVFFANVFLPVLPELRGTNADFQGGL
jgi:hypothetical protein